MEKDIKICRVDDEPVIQTKANGVTMTARFSRERSAGLKEKVREILTESYEERLMKMISSGG